jgi:hypothetical protein
MQLLHTLGLQRRSRCKAEVLLNRQPPLHTQLFSRASALSRASGAARAKPSQPPRKP